MFTPWSFTPVRKTEKFPGVWDKVPGIDVQLFCLIKTFTLILPIQGTEGDFWVL